MSEEAETYLLPKRIGETPRLRAAQLRLLAKSAGYQMLTENLERTLRDRVESLIRFNPQGPEDLGFVVSLQVEARVLASLVGGFGMKSIVDEMIASELEDVKAGEETDSEQEEEPYEETAPSPLL